MALTDLWQQDRKQLLDKRVHQIIAFAGNGRLGDDSAASTEFREYLGVVPTDMLARYADDCLDSFQESGLALQDLVNQIGRRLGFSVADGRYRGKQGVSGHDGLWRLPDGHTILVEVKTTDTYRIDLNVLAGYRKTLASSHEILVDRTSILIVVGRQDTGDLEAQIRGSRLAWDIRLISVGALLRLLRLKESVGDPDTIRRIHAILVPREFTRLDEIVDIVFSAAEDAADEDLDEPDLLETSVESSTATQPAGPKFVPVNFHAACAERLEKHLGIPLVRIAKAHLSSPDNKTRLTCSISKRHDFAGDESYWFAYHPYYLDFLRGADSTLVTFGCGSESKMFVIPLQDFEPWLEGSYITRRGDRFYWHVQIFREGNRWFLKRSKSSGNVDVTKYLIGNQTGAG